MENTESRKMCGSRIFLETLVKEGVDTIFGYPGGQIMNVYDALYDYVDQIRHILVRHEQGAVHAAQGYARMTGRPGVVTVTSGPGATNAITGVADAMIDSTPLVVITGQVGTALLGTDAFQETDVLGMTIPITKWSYQIRSAEDISWAVSRALYIASSGRPGPVVLDFTRDAQAGMAEFRYEKCNFIRSYIPYPKVDAEAVRQAAKMIDEAERPLLIFGQGITISSSENELRELVEKADLPATATLLGLGAMDSEHPNYIGMAGMHGNIASNVMTQECDLLIAVGMRFDDRVTGKTSVYAKQAKIIHIDIDASEIGKNVPVDLGILGNAKEVLPMLTALVSKADHAQWRKRADECYTVENAEVIEPVIHPSSGYVRMGEAVKVVSEVCRGEAVIVTDVGQNQLFGARYSSYRTNRSMLTSGGLGTMGFGLPAAIGAKVGAPDRQVVLFVGDGGLQMTMQELGTIMQEETGVKIVLLNNNWLGNVRMWQQLFWDKRYSFSHMLNPDYSSIAKAYGIGYRQVENREDLREAVEQMFSDERAFLLDIHVEEEDVIMPMVPPGKSVNEIMLSETKWFKC
ncbi:MAG: biosynthetic-type acetolactate synthase large subunit [Bacteroidales bacterium]|nr:biosynthetic-type acetolactate synthase large subunit [Bacteroidales bacterium]